MEHVPLAPREWDVEADVVVVGFGAAGFAASVTAHELGATVVILEKAPEGQEGGNTRVAGQGYLNTSSIDKAAAYLTALCGPYTVPEAMVKVWAEEMCRNNDWLAGLGCDPQEHQHPPMPARHRIAAGGFAGTRRAKPPLAARADQRGDAVADAADAVGHEGEMSADAIGPRLPRPIDRVALVGGQVKRPR